MGPFEALLPELILSIGGTILMMVAAFTGRRGSGLVSWLAIALLLGATYPRGRRKPLTRGKSLAATVRNEDHPQRCS